MVLLTLNVAPLGFSCGAALTVYLSPAVGKSIAIFYSSTRYNRKITIPSMKCLCFNYFAFQKKLN